MSAVPEAQAALVALLSGRPDYSGVFVRFGLPTELPKQNERAYVLEDVPAHHRSRPSAFAEDTFDLQLVIEVFRSGDDAAAVNARLWELIDAADAALSEDDFYGYATEDGELSAEVQAQAFPDGRLLSATLTIALVSRD